MRHFSSLEHTAHNKNGQNIQPYKPIQWDNKQKDKSTFIQTCKKMWAHSHTDRKVNNNKDTHTHCVHTCTSDLRWERTWKKDPPQGSVYGGKGEDTLVFVDGDHFPSTVFGQDDKLLLDQILGNPSWVAAHNQRQVLRQLNLNESSGMTIFWEKKKEENMRV